MIGNIIKFKKKESKNVIFLKLRYFLKMKFSFLTSLNRKLKLKRNLNKTWKLTKMNSFHQALVVGRLTNQDIALNVF